MKKFKKKSKIDWVSSEYQDDQIYWFPVFTVEFNPNYKRVFGLTSDGFWMCKIVREDSYQINIIKEKPEYLSLITVLEKDRNDIEQLVLEGFRRGFDGDEVDVFPFVDLIKFAIDKDRGYWALKAVNWLRQDDFDNELCEIVKDIINKKNLDQKSRHLIFKMMKRYDRTQV